MKRNRLVKSQKDRVIHSSETYWEQIAKNLIDEDISESPLANPDMLSEESGLYFQSTSETNQELVKAIKTYVNAKLTERERLVLYLLAEGKTLREVAAFLGATPKTISTSLFRARTKIKSFVIKYQS